MEIYEANEVQLSDVCRSCLIKTDNMLNFTQKNEENCEVIAMLASVGNIEIQINELLPCYLCKGCEEKLRLSYEFQLLIQRSNEIIKDCLNSTEMLIIQKPDDCSDENMDSKFVKSKFIKTQRKLIQFSATEVEDAINENKEKFSKNIDCIKCGFSTINSRSLSVHMSLVHRESKDKWCSICNLEVDNLTDHTSSHSNDLLKCKFCGKKFNNSGHFYEHLRTHSSSKPHVCSICHKGFTAKRHLDKHLRIHLNVYKFSRQLSPQNFCKMCKKRVRSLDAHLKKSHNPETPPIRKDGALCMLCGKKFSSQSHFRLHMRVHTGETPYKCQYCDKRMSNRNHLVTHERTHTGEKPYICTICGKRFSQNSVLNTHMKIHVGRPVSCHICTKRFCRPAQLRLHMRKHTGETPYKCTECEQAFRQQSHLSEHLKRHSDARPYQCSFCDKDFKKKSILKTHLAIHTGEKPFKCSQCSYACRQRYSLTKHMKRHSNDAPNPAKPHFCNLCQKGYSTMAMLLSHNDLVHK